MVKFVFIVLHYNDGAFVDTCECIQSIKLLDGNCRVVVIENGSNDRSKELLLNEFANDSMVNIIVSKENLGFARGNNLGCKFAISKYSPDFLVVINNDTFIKQKTFLKLIDAKYEKIKFDILGPYIYDRNLNPQNPTPHLLTSLDEVTRVIARQKKVLLNINANPLWLQVKIILRKILIAQRDFLSLLLKEKEKGNIDISRYEIRNIGLHGAALVFSKKYYTKYDSIFDSRTFLFGEEDILHNRVIMDQLTSIYYPAAEIFHKEDKSTDAVFASGKEKKIFIMNNVLKSLNILKEILENHG